MASAAGIGWNELLGYVATPRLASREGSGAVRHGDRGAPKIRYRWNLALHRFAGAALASVCDGGLIRGGSPMKIELNHVLHLANATSTLAGLVIIGAGPFS